MVEQRPDGLELDIATQGFIERKSISLKRHGHTDCAFRVDVYKRAYIFRFHILSIRARFS